MECEVCGKSDKDTKLHKTPTYNNGYLCRKHYEQIITYGKILERTKDSMNEYSEIITDDKVIKIILKNKRYEKIGEAIVDLDNHNIVKDKRWSMSVDGYAVTRIDGKLKFLHYLIMGIESVEGMVVDHIDRNKLNNRAENLRLIEKHKNHMNHKGYRNNKSGFTGVVFDKGRNKWKALIHINKKQKLIGRFSNIEDAIIARLNAELQYYGEEFSPQRHLFDKYGITQ